MSGRIPERPQFNAEETYQRKGSPFMGTSPIANLSSQAQATVAHPASLKPQSTSTQPGFGTGFRPSNPQNVRPISPSNRPTMSPQNQPGIPPMRPGPGMRPVRPGKPVIHMPNQPPHSRPQGSPRVLSPVSQNQQQYPQKQNFYPPHQGQQQQHPVSGYSAMTDPNPGYAPHQQNYSQPQQPPYNVGSPNASSTNVDSQNFSNIPQHGSKRRQYPAQAASVYSENIISSAPKPGNKKNLPKHTGEIKNITNDYNSAPFGIAGADLFVPGEYNPSIPAIPKNTTTSTGYPEITRQGSTGLQRYPSVQNYNETYPATQYGQQEAPVTNAVAPVDSMATQFGSMSFGSGNPNYQVNVLAGHPQIQELEAPPPPITLPAGIPCCPSETHLLPPIHKRSTLNAIPKTDKLLKKSKLPFGILLTPYFEQEGIPPPPTVNEIVRCRRCRSYINPYVTFIEGGRRWKCNLCELANDVPMFFDYDSIAQTTKNRWERAELLNSVVEFVAPADYMVRPPMPPVYFFIIDVSYPSIQLGLPEVIGNTILEILDKLPNDEGRTKVGFITVDSSLHFYSIRPEGSEPQMIVVADFDSVFIPSPTDLLVNLSECKEGIKSLLAKLGQMFSKSHVVGNAVGPALMAAQKILTPTGGKIILLQSSTPTIGEAALTPREETKILGTPQESDALKPQHNWYKNFAADCSRFQIAVDTIFFGHQPMDIQTIVCLSRYTGGSMFYYPTFMSTREPEVRKFKEEITKHLSARVGLEAVIRVRASRGLRLAAYYGHFFLRSLDLLALPFVTPNHSYAIDVEIEESLTGAVAYFQTALLHTACNGERRIRVSTLAIPTTENIHTIFHHADQVAIAALLAKKAVDRALVSKLQDARDAIKYKCLEIMSAFKTECTQSSSGAVTQIKVPRNLQLLPLLTLSILKHTSLRPGNTISFGNRIAAMASITVLSPEILITPCLVPRLYGLQLGADFESSILPVFPSAESLSYQGVFLLYDGHNIFLWLGRDANPELVHSLLGVDVNRSVPSGVISLPVLTSEEDGPNSPHILNKYVNQLVTALGIQTRGLWSPITYICKENGEPLLKTWMHQRLVLDRDPSLPSYQEFIGESRDKINRGSF
ncbi:hypothetical protein BB559_003544 [Furculomyces boomerangus]|uniref:Protein transport protein SEC24 n=1 Tax=Furculomyces boomerangus TaxID=61424 RepID=A0A2T9XZ91_9FUNG|nr:hypothetical protein BB559_007043 [Furculomyces boomerangus]PVU85662.1 hypothetical protein BB559_006875 [Furculomyces boomerangus]PVU92917.1 hypothetical protein BB559_003544 [Furculomyces boomerangus]